MAKALVIVESPAKAKTINKYLGDNFIVTASGGHMIDLPKSKMGVDVEDNFRADYVVIPARKKTFAQIKKDSKKMKDVYLAADPDREGEAICWHIKQKLDTDAKVHRVVFHEITERAIKEAFAHPRAIDINKVQAQQARRILDRLVGYSLSPLLWKKITRGLSAGRVQSVTLRLLVERERQIGHFIPQEYWEVEAELKKKAKTATFIAKLDKIDGNKPEVKSKQQGDELLEKLKHEEFIVTDILKKQKKRNPQAPYTTSKLQQDSFNQLRFSASRTMLIAQQLYEGIELGTEGSVGLITYMRTDAVRISSESQEAARDYIVKKFGNDYLPAKVPRYKAKKSAQEAHEAVRPAVPLREPDQIKQYLAADQYKLYKLIWNKFISSQMKAAVYQINTIVITAGNCLFKVVGSDLKFAGCLKIFGQTKQEQEKKDQKQPLPVLDKGEVLDLVNLLSHQHFTQPPPRYSDASLVKMLEEKGIGRPSTYAPTIQTIVMRDYSRRERGYLFPTELGFTVSDLLTKYFPKILNIKFTATLEEDLDEVEEGKLNWAEVVKVFYEPFAKELDVAQKKIKKEAIPTDEICELCGKPMVMKWGRHGRFLSCSDFPTCKHAKSITTEVQCPEETCDGWLVERRTRRGKVFYGCSKYPKCTYAANKLPGPEDNG